VQGCKCGIQRTFRVTGLGRREPGSGVQVRVQVRDLNFTPLPAPVPDGPHLRPEGRDLGPETVSCRLSQHAVLTLPVKCLHDRGYHAVAIFGGHAGAGREAEALVEEAFADFAAMHLGRSKDGLEVHGLPDGTGFDVLSLERETDLLAGDSGEDGIDGEASEPVGRLSPRGFGLHGHAGQSLEGFGVGFEVAAAAADFSGEPRELAKADAGRNITQAIIIPDGGMLIVRSGVAGLGSEEARLLGQFGIIGNEHTAATGGDDFVAVKGMDASESERTR